MNHRQRLSGRRWQLLSGLGAALILVLASGACFSTPTPVPIPTLLPTPTLEPTATPVPTRTATPRPTATATPTATPSYLITSAAVDETVTVGDLVLTVTQIASSTVDAPGPEVGRQFVLLELTIQNTGDHVIGINPTRDLIMKDGSDQIYKISSAAMAATGGTTPDVDLAPGETIRAQIGFSVPLEAGGLQLAFGADRFRAGKIFIRLF